ncbi:MAG: TraB/GumN family protein [Lentisphaeria bacterium]|jgi:uncharacterized protein YbaP (TraB family)|nr:TraB/GumN family protein [Lentisphaeria bacterium]
MDGGDMRRGNRLLWIPLVLGTLATAEPTDRPLLWRACRADGTTIHLLGSLHIGRADFYPVHPQVAAAYAAADLCVFEVDMAKAASPWSAVRMMLRGRLGEGKTLEQTVGPETWAEVQACAERLGLPLVMLRPLKPWFCAQMLTATAVVRAGYDPQRGTDQHFFRLGRQDGKQVKALETVGQQLDLLEKALEPLGNKVLTQTLEDLADLEESLGALVAVWRRGDEEALAGVLREMEVADEAAHAILITDRNRKWAPLLAAFADSPRPVPEPKEGEPPPVVPTGPRRLFVVIGAGHLVGENSLPQLLRQQGWTVERE